MLQCRVLEWQAPKAPVFSPLAFTFEFPGSSLATRALVFGSRGRVLIPPPKLSVPGSSVLPDGAEALKLHVIERYRLQRAQWVLYGRFSVRHYIHRGAFGGEQGGGGEPQRRQIHYGIRNARIG